MKIAVLSDIHGNREAFEAVMADIQEKEINKIFICGDLAGAGPEPAALIDIVKELDATVIQGNTDEYIAFDNFVPPNLIMANALKFAVENTTDEQKKYLAELPFSHSEEIEGVKMLFVHGSPRKNNEDIMPGEPVEKIEPMLEGVEEDVIFCGHTHLPAGYQVKKKTVVNVGSVGRPFTDDVKPCYVTVDVENGEMQILHHFIDYDAKTASEKLAALDFEGSDKLAAMLLKATTRYP